MMTGAGLHMGISIRTTFRTMVLVVCLFFAASPVFAASTPWIGDAHAAARMMTAVRATGSAGQLDAALQIRLAPGWHAYWRSPGDAGFPPSIDWSGSQNLKSAAIYWSAPKRFRLDGLITQGYEKNVVLPIAVTMRQPGGPVLLHALVHYAACKDICVPYTAAFTLRLPAGLATPGARAPLIAQAWTRIPGSLTDAGLSLASVIVSPASGQGAELSVSLRSQQAIASPDMFVEGVTGPTPGRPKIQLGDTGHRAVLSVFLAGSKPGAVAGRPLTFTIEANGQAATFEAAPVPGGMPRIGGSVFDPLIILIALLGGLVLNVMPCVLPVLSLKLFGLVEARGQALRQFRLSLLATAAGVMASFLVLALVLVLLKTAGAAIGWGIQFQQPWFLGAMAVVTSLFAASLWEWVPIGVPGFVGALGAGRGKHVAAFLTGALAGVLAASCTAPFIGTAVGFALARGPMTIIGIFTALGLGMALPYLVVAALPRLVGWLPKPGAWMVRLQVVLGFLLLGTAMWLVWVISAVVSPNAAIITGVVLGIFLLVLFLRQQKRLLKRWRPALTGLAVGLGLSAGILPGLIQQSVAAPAVSTIWQPFDEARIPGFVARNRVVFVDITAAWCLICKVNALTVLERSPVAPALRAADVTAMRGDWTRPSPVITAYLERFDRYGVPLDVVYGPGAPRGIVLPSLLTPGVVMDALRRAGGR